MTIIVKRVSERSCVSQRDQLLPNELMVSIHNRMPAILQPADEAAWLDPNLKDVPEILSLLHPYPDGALEAHAVSRRLNAPAFDDASCIAAIESDEE